MTSIVTGATGFIGGRLVEALLAAGEEVRCPVRRPAPVDSPLKAKFQLTDFDRSDLGLTDSVFEGVDTVYHVAGATRATSPAKFREANVAVTERLIDRLVGLPGPRPRFIYISSQAAAGPTLASARGKLADGTPAMTESDAALPIEPYGWSKLAGERAVLARATDIAVTIIRPVAVYGPGDRDFLSIFRMVRRGLAVYPGIRDSVATTIFVDDLVRGIIAAARSPTAIGNTYFMGSDTAVSWRAIYAAVGHAVDKNTFREVDVPIGFVRLGGVCGDLVGRVTGRPPLLSSGKAALAAARLWTCSSAHAASDFGFQAGTPLHDGMRVTYDWYLRHRWL